MSEGTPTAMGQHDNRIRTPMGEHRAHGEVFGEGDRVRHVGLNLPGRVCGVRDGLIVVALASRSDPATPIDHISVLAADIEHLD